MGDLLASGLRSLQTQLEALPPDAKAAVIVRGDAQLGSVVIGTAANLGRGWVFSLEAEFAIKQKPTAQFTLGKVWK